MVDSETESAMRWARCRVGKAGSLTTLSNPLQGDPVPPPESREGTPPSASEPEVFSSLTKHGGLCVTCPPPAANGCPMFRWLISATTALGGMMQRLSQGSPVCTLRWPGGGGAVSMSSEVIRATAGMVLGEWGSAWGPVQKCSGRISRPPFRAWRSVGTLPNICGVLVLHTRPSDLDHLGTRLGDLSPVLLQVCGSLGHRLSGPALLPKSRDAAQTGAQQGAGT